MPKGYQFDYINTEVIERDLFVKDGLLTLPHGTQYRMLVLPKLETMRPELLAKIKQLIEDGAIVMGPAPQRSPSMQNYPNADKQVKQLADALWNGLDGERVKYVKRGKGQLLYGMTMEEAFAHIGCVPDCALPAEAPVLYGHRTVGNTEIYFLSNQADKTIEVSPEFRVRSMQPEHWNAIDGSIRPLPAYQSTQTGTIVPLRLQPFESAFIVFRKAASRGEGKTVEMNFPTPQALVHMDSGWKVSFDPKFRGPVEPQTFNRLMDISQSENDSIRYYSGTIRYENEFTLADKPSGELFLNLNDVGVMAKVKINGTYAGGVWTPPYRVRVTDLVQPGTNRVEIEVVTTWMNRLIGDSGLPEAERGTWAPVNRWKPTDTLQKSGLVGPVCLEAIF